MQLIPNKGRYICEVMSREKKLASGLWLADKMNSNRKNIAKVISVGKPAIHTCETCEEYDLDRKIMKKRCFRAWKVYPCKRKNKPTPIIAREGDIVHFKSYFGKKVKHEDKELIFLTNADIIAVEKGGE